MSVYSLEVSQALPIAQQEAWEFLSDPRNLERITPPYMRMRITSEPPSKVYAGMIITYSVRPLIGMSMRWVSEITHMKEGHYFVDEQRKGPYALWHHEHHIIPTEEGVVMRDKVTYQLPFGMLGRLAHWLFVRRQLKGIFAYRESQLKRIFPSE